ncbi:MAG: MgtC/SapB family protein [Desulfobulbaceae bacterium]|nr:MgtC/SapB family protein [Candidatus Kapabacteria bacterium]MBS4000607.1 MgtC/SapB family protein [Desulfobulbaceae bacterium]
MASDMELWEYTLRIGIAFFLGGMIGFERQYRQKSAGLRTNTLVSIGSAAFVMLSYAMTGETGDPSRVAGQIVTGIGFLGAGVIIREGANVQGLNTAATIWCSAAVGSLVGAGLYSYGVITALAVVLTLIILRPLAMYLSRRKEKHTNEDYLEAHYTLTISCNIEAEPQIRPIIMEAISENDLQLQSLKSKRDEQSGNLKFEAQIISEGRNNKHIENFAKRIGSDRNVSEIGWILTKTNFN